MCASTQILAHTHSYFIFSYRAILVQNLDSFTCCCTGPPPSSARLQLASAPMIGMDENLFLIHITLLAHSLAKAHSCLLCCNAIYCMCTFAIHTRIIIWIFIFPLLLSLLFHFLIHFMNKQLQNHSDEFAWFWIWTYLQIVILYYIADSMGNKHVFHYMCLRRCRQASSYIMQSGIWCHSAYKSFIWMLQRKHM